MSEERGEEADSKSWRWCDVGRGTSHTKLKGYRRGKVKDEAEKKEGTKERRRKKRESRGQRGFGGGTGV